MSRRIIGVLAVITVLSALILASYTWPNDEIEPTINANIVETRSFDLTDDNTGSHCSGFVLVFKEDRVVVKILVKLSKAEGDFGGFSFTCDSNLIPVSVNTGFGVGLHANGAFIQKGSIYGDGGVVYIGSEWFDVPVNEKMDGFAEIVFQSSRDTDIADIKISIGVGSKIKDDFPVIYPTRENITIDLGALDT